MRSRINTLWFVLYLPCYGRQFWEFCGPLALNAVVNSRVELSIENDHNTQFCTNTPAAVSDALINETVTVFKYSLGRSRYTTPRSHSWRFDDSTRTIPDSVDRLRQSLGSRAYQQTNVVCMQWNQVWCQRCLQIMQVGNFSWDCLLVRCAVLYGCVCSSTLFSRSYFCFTLLLMLVGTRCRFQ